MKSSKSPDWNIPQLKRSIGSSWCYHDWVVIFRLVASTKFKSRPLWFYGGVLVPVVWVAFISLAAPLMFRSAWTTCCHCYVFFNSSSSRDSGLLSNWSHIKQEWDRIATSKTKCLLKLSVVIFQYISIIFQTRFLKLYLIFLLYSVTLKLKRVCKSSHSHLFFIKAVSKSSNKRTVKAVIRKLYLSIKSKITHSIGWAPRVF